MYDIKIFLEENWQFGARVNAGKEIIYWLGNSQEELMKNIEEGLKISFENKEKNNKVSRLFSYVSSNNNLVCH